MLFLVGEQCGRKSGNTFVGGQHKGSGRASRGDFLIFFRWFPWEKHLDRPPPCNFGFVWVLAVLRASCGHSPSRACSTLLLQWLGSRRDYSMQNSTQLARKFYYKSPSTFQEEAFLLCGVNPQSLCCCLGCKDTLFLQSCQSTCLNFLMEKWLAC